MEAFIYIGLGVAAFISVVFASYDWDTTFEDRYPNMKNGFWQ